MGDAKRRRDRGETPPSRFLAKQWFIPQEGRVHYALHDVLAFNGKRFRVGVGIGTVSPVAFTEAGTIVYGRLLALDADAQVMLIEIAKVGNIERQLRQNFERASEDTLIMLVCANSAVVDGLLEFMEYDRAATAHPDTALPDRRSLERNPDFEQINEELARTSVWNVEVIDMLATSGVPPGNLAAVAGYLVDLERPARCLTCRTDVDEPLRFSLLTAALGAETAFVSSLCDACAAKPWVELERDLHRAYSKKIKGMRKVEIHPTGGTA
jgi:hypothetical protein